jgi:hypothetical protein
MALPKIDSAIFTATLPSNGKKIKYRPFLVKEEKILMIAQESQEQEQIVDAIKQILNNCIITKNVDIDSWPLFDVEWMFVKLRAASINNVVKLKYKDKEDEKVYDFEIDLNEIEMTTDPDHSNPVMLTDEIGMTLRYPNIDLITFVQQNVDEEKQTEASFSLIKKSIENVFDKEQVYDDWSEKEIDEFLGDLSHVMLEKIQGFFESLPKLYHKFEYENSKGNKRSIELNGIADFFT